MINNVVIVSGVQQSDTAIHIHVSILFQILFPFRLFHNIEQSSLCYTVGPCWLFMSFLLWSPSLSLLWSLSLSLSFVFLDSSLQGKPCHEHHYGKKLKVPADNHESELGCRSSVSTQVFRDHPG